MDALTQPLHCDGERLSKGNLSPPLLRNEVIHADLRDTEPHQQRFDTVPYMQRSQAPDSVAPPLGVAKLSSCMTRVIRRYG